MNIPQLPKSEAMKYIAQFDYPSEYKIILRDSYHDDCYYGLDNFDCKYLKIIQSKFGCINSFHSIPDRVKMEMSVFQWNEMKQKFEVDDKNRQTVQLNRLEILIKSYSVNA